MVIEGTAVPVDNTVLDKSLKLLENNITGDAKERFDQFRGEFGIQKNSGEETSVGMVVVPSSGSEQGDARIKEEVGKTFSDEVAVKPKDDESGVVVPQFKERDGDEYIYMMVPIQKSENN
jgi:hypothetical protein